MARADPPPRKSQQRQRRDVRQAPLARGRAAEDGAVIDIADRGFCHPAPGSPDQYDGTLHVTHAGHYYRTSPVFRTDAPAHRRLAETVFVGLARPDGDDVVVIRLYALR
ncbi:DUF3237 family protein [Streptomyces sp. NPDC047017]|uniref:DUF3237 family protein n=1 Tax=Streptomyces sp. NPDC047017 TaxID=3155024 RepID=UPI00340022C3